MGPSLRTWELASWARSRKLSDADETMLRAVFEERDRLAGALEEVVVDAEVRASTIGESLTQAACFGRALLSEVSP